MARALLLATVLALAACREPDMIAPPQDPRQIDYAPQLHVDFRNMTRTQSGLYYQDVRTGRGAVAMIGDTVRLLYAGYLPDGTLVEARLDTASAAAIPLGAGHLIAGWEEGIPGMREGGIRKLIIPPELGFGTEGRPPVPPNAILVVDIELLATGDEPLPRPD
jgi:FKBP-type peptidyl-prolyl cis-trans isomerase